MATGAESSSIRLAELVAALSLATDLGMGQPLEFALQTALLAVRLGEALGIAESALRDCYYTALLRSSGCTADSTFTAKVFGDEITARTWLAQLDFGRPTQVLAALVRNVGSSEPPFLRAQRIVSALSNLPSLPDVESAHCEVAQQLASRLKCGSEVVRALGHVFERWDGRGLPRKVKGENLALAARVVAVAQDAALFGRLYGAITAAAVVKQRAGSAYDPPVAAAFCERAPSLLAELESDSLWERVLAAEPAPYLMLPERQLDAATQAIGDFADLLSPHLVGHSRGVGDLGDAAARLAGLSAASVTAVRRAGYLHDVGRTGISAAIWNRAGPLQRTEWERVRLHPYYTHRVLARSSGLAQLGELAACHHERMDGSGYHRGIPAAMQTLEARILAAADVYHALGESRPHRPARSADASAEQLQQAVQRGQIDADAANAVLHAAGHVSAVARRTWPAGLTDREVDVLRPLARGESNRQIAARLVVAEATIHHHVLHIYSKLGVSTRAAATLKALQFDLLGGTPAQHSE